MSIELTQKMNHRLSFESEQLTVDWISFAFSSLDSDQQQKLTNYLSSIGFNSYLKSKKEKNAPKEILQKELENNFQALLIVESTRYWHGTLLQFSGENAAQFYQQVKTLGIDWKFFSDAKLSRLDLCYTLETPIDKDEIRSFFHECRLKSPLKTISHDETKHGTHVLRLGSRTSNRFFRIYTKGKNQLRFEHEMKGDWIKEYTNMLMDNSWENFENKLSQKFFHYFGKYLRLESKYLVWLAIKLQAIQVKPASSLTFNTDYLTSIQELNDQKELIQFLKFLQYVKDLDYSLDFLGSTKYRSITFPISSFINFQQPSLKTISSYQMKKFQAFFEKLHKSCIVSMFDDNKFQSLVSVPKAEISKEGHQWMVTVWIVDVLFYYNYPFSFPDLFPDKLSKSQFAVQFEVLQIFSSQTVEKTFDVKGFIENYPSVLSNQGVRQIKQYFIDSVNLLQRNNLIQPTFKVFRNRNIEYVDQLTTQNISEGFIIYEKLNLFEPEEDQDIELKDSEENNTGYDIG